MSWLKYVIISFYFFLFNLFTLLNRVSFDFCLALNISQRLFVLICYYSCCFSFFLDDQSNKNGKNGIIVPYDKLCGKYNLQCFPSQNRYVVYFEYFEKMVFSLSRSLFLLKQFNETTRKFPEQNSCKIYSIIGR